MFLNTFLYSYEHCCWPTFKYEDVTFGLCDIVIFHYLLGKYNQ